MYWDGMVLYVDCTFALSKCLQKFLIRDTPHLPQFSERFDNTKGIIISRNSPKEKGQKDKQTSTKRQAKD